MTEECNISLKKYFGKVILWFLNNYRLTDFNFVLFNFFFFSGKYMQMMNILKPIAFDVIHFMSQLFDYYLYAIYTFFGRNDSVS